MGMGGQRYDPAALPQVMTRYPLYRRLDGPQSRSGRVRKISPPPPPAGFDPRTVQPVASGCMDHAIPAYLNWSFVFLHKLSFKKFSLFRLISEQM
jgi:hypothetical protein